MGQVGPFRMGHVEPRSYTGFIGMSVIEMSLNIWDVIVDDLL